MDAAFLALETPELPMHVVGVLLLDPSAGDGYSAAALRQVIADRLHLMPPFCRRPVELGQAGLSAVGGAVRMARDLTGVLSRHGRAALPSPAPRMPISGAATERRTAAFTALPLELTRATKDAAGVKLNDVVLAVVAMAVRRYLAARDITPGRDLVASVPLNAG